MGSFSSRVKITGIYFSGYTNVANVNNYITSYTYNGIAAYANTRVPAAWTGTGGPYMIINRADIRSTYPSSAPNGVLFAVYNLKKSDGTPVYVVYKAGYTGGDIWIQIVISPNPDGSNAYTTIANNQFGHIENSPTNGVIMLAPVIGTYNGDTIFGICNQLGYQGNSSWITPSNTYTVSYVGFSMQKLSNYLGSEVTVDSKEYSDEYGAASSAGGYTGGTFDDSSDTIGLPTTPALGVTSAGFVNVYNPSAGALQNLGAELFPDLTFTPDAPISGTGGVTEAIEAMATALVNFGNQIPNIVNMYINSNLIQYVIDCHILPVAPTVGAAENIKIGFKTFTPSAARVSSDYVDFDCGTLSLGEFYANFIDYAPYTRAKLFLPFVGFVDIAPEYWQSGSLNVVYRFNIIDGSFMAFVKSTSSKSKLSDSVIAQYGGNACVHIPLTGLNYSSMVSGVVSAAAAVVSAQSGVQAATKAIGGAVDVMNSKPPVQQSNGYNATTSFLGVRTPYLLIERSVSNFSASYASEKGIPSNISTSFANLSGFTTASDIHLDGITGATEAELNEIARLLSEGVIL